MSKHILLAGALFMAIGGPASSGDLRSWYPKQCVAIHQCAPVESLAWTIAVGAGSTQLLVSSIHGKAIVPKDFPVQESKDERAHVCLRYDPFGSLEVTCLLVPSRLF